MFMRDPEIGWQSTRRLVPASFDEAFPDTGLRWRARLALAAIAMIVASCAAEQPPAEPAPEAVANEALQLRFSSVPSGFRVARNENDHLELAEVEGEGRMWVTVGLEGANINLVEILNSQRELFESLDHGEYAGGNELVAPLGPAYYGRGSFDEGGQRWEEVRVFTVHPTLYRLLTLYYRYPAGADSGARVSQVLELLAAIEANSETDASTSEG